MTPPLRNHDDWSQCPIGHLQRYALTEKRQMWIRIASRTAVVVGLIAITASATVYSYFTVAPSSDALLTNPHCQDIIPLIESFSEGKLSAEDVQRVKSHLKACGHCRQLASPGAVRAAMPHAGTGCPSHAASAGGIPAKQGAAL